MKIQVIWGPVHNHTGFLNGKVTGCVHPGCRFSLTTPEEKRAFSRAWDEAYRKRQEKLNGRRN